MCKGLSHSVIDAWVGWFHRQKRVMPWRENPSFYPVWVSEIMLQQTQVTTVIPYFSRFMEAFPSVEDLAKAKEEKVLTLWAGLGYYSRARNLHAAAKIICESGFPPSRQGWLDLPGVGPYTAGAVLSIAGNLPEAILDGNAERVIARYYSLFSPIDDSKTKKRFWEISHSWVNAAQKTGHSPRDFNQAVMELGALLCTPQNPQCGECPLRRSCKGFKNKTAQSLPKKSKKLIFKKINETVMALISPRQEILLVKDSKAKWRRGLWDLPRLESLVKRSPDGELKISYTVTRHHVFRKVKVWQQIRRKEVQGLNQQFLWVSLKNVMTDSSIALGAPAKKILSQLVP